MQPRQVIGGLAVLSSLLLCIALAQAGQLGQKGSGLFYTSLFAGLGQFVVGLGAAGLGVMLAFFMSPTSEENERFRPIQTALAGLLGGMTLAGIAESDGVVRLFLNKAAEEYHLPKSGLAAWVATCFVGGFLTFYYEKPQADIVRQDSLERIGGFTNAELVTVEPTTQADAENLLEQFGSRLDALKQKFPAEICKLLLAAGRYSEVIELAKAADRKQMSKQHAEHMDLRVAQSNYRWAITESDANKLQESLTQLTAIIDSGQASNWVRLEARKSRAYVLCFVKDLLKPSPENLCKWLQMSIRDSEAFLDSRPFDFDSLLNIVSSSGQLKGLPDAPPHDRIQSAVVEAIRKILSPDRQNRLAKLLEIMRKEEDYPQWSDDELSAVKKAASIES